MVKAIKKKSKKTESREEAPEIELQDLEEEGQHSIFDDPTVSQTVAEDPLFKFFKRWSNHILGVCVLIFCVWTVMRMLESTHIESQKSAAQMYAGLRLDLQEIEQLDTQRAIKEAELLKLDDTANEDSANEDSANEDKKRLQEEIEGLVQERATMITKSQGKLVALKEMKSPYNAIGEMYDLLFSQLKDSAATTNAGWSKEEAESVERLFKEVAALRTAREGLDTPERLDEARTNLKSLASEGSFMHAMAAKTLAEIAASHEEREEALEVLKEVLKRHPEQAEIIEQDIKHLENLLTS